MTLRILLAIIGLTMLGSPGLSQPPKRDFPYRELTGRAEGYRYIRQWRSYYWREDFTFVLRTEGGKTLRIISREPTPWTNLRLGTTFTGLKVEWDKKPRVQVIGVGAIDRIPEEFYDVKLDKDQTVTAFIVRVELEVGGKKIWRDFFINNWFHRWGKDADAKVLSHYARKESRYGIYGYVSGHYAPFDSASKKLLEKYEPEYNGVIYHAHLVKADNAIGYELKVLHLMGRHKKSAEYRVFHGNAKELTRLDDRPPMK